MQAGALARHRTVDADGVGSAARQARDPAPGTDWPGRAAAAATAAGVAFLVLPAALLAAGGLGDPGTDPASTAAMLAPAFGLAVLGAVAIWRRAGVEAEARRKMSSVAERLEQEILRRERLEDERLRSLKMEALGRLTGGVAHDINNMLTAIRGSLDMMDPHVAAPGRDRLAIARQALETAEATTRQLLVFARPDAASRRPADVGALVARSRPLIEGLLRGDVELSIEAEPDLPAVELDPSQFRMVLANLVGNACDAMPGGGKLAVRARAGLRPDDDGGGARPCVVVEVSDTGVGMTSEVAAQAFDPFFTTKDVGRGTGLGLTGVYAFARQSGGTAEIESRPGAGTTVRLLLPPARPRPPRSAAARPSRAVPPPLPPARAAPPRRRVLLVEDEAIVRVVVTDALRAAGMDVVSVPDGVAALEALDARGPFSAVVSDVVMPRGVSGIDVAREAARRAPGVPVLLVTGYGREDLGPLQEELGFDLLRKPFAPRELVARVAALASAADRGASGRVTADGRADGTAPSA
jgi:two-component system NtrC family sensor kinase